MRKQDASIHFAFSLRKIIIFIIAVFLLGILSFYLSSKKTKLAGQAEAAKFEYLSKNGNSSCSSAFRDSIQKINDSARLQGSCCSPMNYQKYHDQIEGLKKYKDIPEIPPDPYDIQAGLAKKLMRYYDSIMLTADQQKEYDYAMQNSKEKGPCCCRCWRWNVFGGLGKYLIQHDKFTGKQIAEIWNLSDGCGGNG